MKFTLLAAAMALGFSYAFDASAEQGDWTIHTVSVHAGVTGLNNFNPGLAYDVRDDLRVGALYNSYEKPSLYVAKLFNIKKRFRAGVGVISGYKWDSDQNDVTGKTTGILPLVAAEFDIAPNISILWFGQAFNLEVKF
jgi:hypothetical protein